MQRRELLILLPIAALFIIGCGKNEQEGRDAKSPVEKDSSLERSELIKKDEGKQKVLRYPNGNKKLVGRYEEGKREGVWSSWYEDGQLKSEAKYRNGKRHGFSKTWYPNGQLRYKGRYHHGERSGEWTFYDREGEVVKKERYDPKESE